MIVNSIVTCNQQTNRQTVWKYNNGIFRNGAINYNLLKNNQVDNSTCLLVSFGINIAEHAAKRIKEREISIENIFQILKQGKKFFVPTNERVISVGFNNEGKIPEGSLLVVTDKTGNELITTHLIEQDECEIIGDKLSKKSHKNPDKIDSFENWSEHFNDEIYESVVYVETPVKTPIKPVIFIKKVKTTPPDEIKLSGDISNDTELK